MLRRLPEILAVLLLAFILTASLTYPLIWKINRVGRYDTADGQFSIWNVAWVARTLVTDPRHVFDANIFYPHRRTLAFSEANLGAGALAVPVYWATGDPIAAHNVVVLIAFILSATSTYYLARYLTGRRSAAAFAAIAFAFCPHVMTKMPHIQLLMTFGLPLSMVACHRFVDRPSMARAVTLGIALAAQAVSCAYYGVFAGLTVGLAVLYFAGTRGLWRSGRYWAGVAVAAAISILIVLPLFMPYWELKLGGFVRSMNENRMYSADWRAYLASAAWSHRWMLAKLAHWREVLFPGFLPTMLGLSGVALALSAPKASPVGESVPSLNPTATRWRETAVFYTLLGGLSFWASFGPDAGLYKLFFNTMPVFSLFRAPSRTGLMVTLTLAVLGAIALDRFTRRSWSLRQWLPGVAAALVTIELAAIPLNLPELRPPSPAYKVLSLQPYGPVAEFPFYPDRRYFHLHAVYMFSSMYHWMPLLNGYSDYIPFDFRQIAWPVSSFPSTESFAILKKHRVRYVVFHLNLFDHRRRERLLTRIEEYREYLRPLVTEDVLWLYEIVAWPR
ncbi:MAG: hypothetical protein HYX76_15330 [Acidobacteria bacterium]|nr:hypothetical protein [Acidobacteriota bacterium]